MQNTVMLVAIMPCMQRMRGQLRLLWKGGYPAYGGAVEGAGGILCGYV